MSNSIISEGHTTSEAIEKGLKILNTTREKVEIKVLEEEKRSFFSILEPRIVKVEMKLKENINNIDEEETISEEEIKKVEEGIKKFLYDIFGKMKINNFKFNMFYKNEYLNIIIEGENVNHLIGYRGETLNALQTIISSYVSSTLHSRVKVVIDINNYKEKRRVVLEDLAVKMANKAIKTKRNVTLEPMQPYERKIIHSKLQNNSKVRTHSIGENQNRRIVIELK